MKTAVIALILAASSAYATTPIEDYQDVKYISWCEKNNVMQENSNGKVYVRVNCTESALTCVQTQVLKTGTVVYTATCR